jgi:ankyrin repeat protein
LHYCAQLGFIEGAKALLDEGASINIQTRLKETPLVLALNENHTSMIQFLISSRADVKKSDVIHRPPISYARDDAAVKMLVEAGCDITMPDDEGLTPMHWAVKTKSETIEILKNYGADIDAIDIYKRTPLHLAAKLGYSRQIGLLLCAGANYHAVDCDHNTPEATARANGFLNLTIIFTAYVEQKQNNDVDFEKLMAVLRTY